MSTLTGPGQFCFIAIDFTFLLITCSFIEAMKINLEFNQYIVPWHKDIDL